MTTEVSIGAYFGAGFFLVRKIETTERHAQQIERIQSMLGTRPACTLSGSKIFPPIVSCSGCKFSGLTRA